MYIALGFRLFFFTGLALQFSVLWLKSATRDGSNVFMVLILAQFNCDNFVFVACSFPPLLG